MQAISHTAQFDRRSATLLGLGEVMDEALDLDALIVWPVDADDASTADAGQLAAMAATAHAELAARAGRSAICSVPIVDEGRTLGVIVLERSGGAAAAPPFDSDTVALCRTLGLLLGPIYALKRDAERSAWRRGTDAVGAASAALVGPGHPGAKLAGALLLLGALLLAFVSVPYRVAARTVVEGAVQRAAVAPFDGYLAESLVRAGDTVQQGQPLARLADRELQLEQGRWRAEHDVAQRKYRQAAAAQDRAAMAMVTAQADQAQAQLSLVEDKLARATVRAPFDGTVVSGDLTQLQGSPVEQGKLLFEIAPLDRWRLVLEVDERDIGPLRPGQTGQLALAGLPHRRLGLVVQRITPISTAQDGRNFFRVEAQLEPAAGAAEGAAAGAAGAATTRTTVPGLRPGMEGIAKVEVGQQRLVWIWTHGLTDWLRLAWWKWSL